MPVTIRLSRLFYERLGDEVADELTNWFNQVDATYRSDLRDINELNYARFDARTGERFAQFEAVVMQRLGALSARIDRVEAELGARIDRVEAELGARIDRVEAELGARIDRVEAELGARMDRVEDRLKKMITAEDLERAMRKQTQFFFLAWATQLAAIIALIIRSA